MLAFDRGEIPVEINDEDSVLHFAAEPILEKRFRAEHKNYKTADLYHAADLKLNIESIDLPNESVKLIIANHVLEHVDDQKAGKELFRVLVKEGVLVCMVPIIEGWDKTYENSSVTTDEQRLVHFGQVDHVRLYGRDFRERIESGGLKLVREITAEGADVIDYGLLRGQKVFVFRKP